MHGPLQGHCDSEILARYALGDADGYRAFFRRHHPRVVAALREAGVAPCECVPRAEQCFLLFHARMASLGRAPAPEDFARVVREVGVEGIRARLHGGKRATTSPDLALIAEERPIELPHVTLTPDSAAERITERALERTLKRVRKDLVEDERVLVRGSLATWAAGAALTALVVTEHLPHGWSEGLVVILPLLVSFGVLSPFQRRRLGVRAFALMERTYRAVSGRATRVLRSRTGADGKPAP